MYTVYNSTYVAQFMNIFSAISVYFEEEFPTERDSANIIFNVLDGDCLRRQPTIVYSNRYFQKKIFENLNRIE